MREARGLAIGRNAEVSLVVDLDNRALQVGSDRCLSLGAELLLASKLRGGSRAAT